MKALKIFVLVVLAVIVLIAGALALFNPNHFKDEIALLLKAATGLELEIRGDIDHSIWNPDQLKIGEIAVTREQSTILQWQSAEADIALGPLLTRSLVIDKLRLEKPRLNLNRQVIEMVFARLKTKGKTTEPTTDQRIPLVHFAILNVEVNDLEFHHQLGEEPLSVKQLDLSAKDLILIQEHEFDPRKIKGEIEVTANRFTHEMIGFEELVLKGQLIEGEVMIEELSVERPRFKPSDLLARINQQVRADSSPRAAQSQTPPEVRSIPDELPLASVVIRRAAINALSLDDQFRGKPASVDNLNLMLDDVRLVHGHRFDLQRLEGKLGLMIDQALYGENRLGRVKLEARLADADLEVTQLDLESSKIVLDQLLSAFNPSDSPVRTESSTRLKSESPSQQPALPLASLRVDRLSVEQLDLEHRLKGEPLKAQQLDLTIENLQLIQAHQFDVQALKGALKLTVPKATYGNSELGKMTLEGKLSEGQVNVSELRVDRPRIELNELLQELHQNQVPARVQQVVSKARLENELALQAPVESVTLGHLVVNDLSLNHELYGKPLTVDNLNLELSDVRLIHKQRLDPRLLRARLALDIEKALYRDSQLGSLKFRGQFTDGNLLFEQINLANPQIVLHQLLGPLVTAKTKRPGNAQSKPDKGAMLFDQLPLVGLKIEQLDVDGLNLEHALEEKTTKISQLNLRARDIDLIHDHKLDLGKAAGEFKTTAQQMRYQQYQIDQLAMESRIGRGQFTVGELIARFFEGKVSVSGRLNLIKSPVPVELDLRLDKLNLAELSSALKLDMPADGLVNSNARLTTRLGEPQQLISSLNGEVEWHGNDLTIHGLDADKLIASMVSSGGSDVFQAAGIMMLTPIGLLARKTVQLAVDVPGIGSGTTQLRQTETRAMIKNGVIEFTDTAAATQKHRVAVKGGIDFNTMSFVDFRFAVLDDKGCARFEQRIGGTLAQPEIGITGAAAKTAIGTVVDPVLDVIDRTGAAVGVETCTPFYQGKVTHRPG